MIRRGLLALLSTDPGLEVVGEAGDGDQAVALVRESHPDVLLLDVRMPRRDGLSIVKEISGLTRVLMLTFTDDDASIHRAMPDGAAGYLIHGTFDAESLAHMVRATASGAAPGSDVALRAIARGAVAPVTEPPGDLGLRARQVEVTDLIAQGRSNSDIARHLFLAENGQEPHQPDLRCARGGHQSRGHRALVGPRSPRQVGPRAGPLGPVVQDEWGRQSHLEAEIGGRAVIH